MRDEDTNFAIFGLSNSKRFLKTRQIHEIKENQNKRKTKLVFPNLKVTKLQTKVGEKWSNSDLVMKNATFSVLFTLCFLAGKVASSLETLLCSSNDQRRMHSRPIPTCDCWTSWHLEAKESATSNVTLPIFKLIITGPIFILWAAKWKNVLN